MRKHNMSISRHTCAWMLNRAGRGVSVSRVCGRCQTVRLEEYSIPGGVVHLCGPAAPRHARARGPRAAPSTAETIRNRMADGMDRVRTRGRMRTPAVATGVALAGQFVPTSVRVFRSCCAGVACSLLHVGNLSRASRLCPLAHR